MSQELLKSQRNEVFKIIEDYQLNHSDFEWSKIESSYSYLDVSKLIHSPTGFYFTFDLGTHTYEPEYSPGNTLRIAHRSVSSWPDMLRVVKTWIAQLSGEINAPDLWELASESKDLIKNSFEENGTDEQFTAGEIKQVKDKIDELNEYIVQTSNLHSEQYAYIATRLNYLKSASERLTKKDWKMIFVGVLINIVMQFDFDSPAAHSIMVYANNLFNEVFQNLIN